MPDARTRSTQPSAGDITGRPTTPPVEKSKPAWKWPMRYSPKPPVTTSGGASGVPGSGRSNGLGSGITGVANGSAAGAAPAVAAGSAASGAGGVARDPAQPATDSTSASV